MSAVLRQVRDCLLTLVYGLLAFIAGGAVIWWLGTGWWPRIYASIAAVAVFRIAAVLTFAGPEPSDG